MNEKPLFTPLKREFFEAFKTGEKIEEFRPEGPRWPPGDGWTLVAKFDTEYGPCALFVRAVTHTPDRYLIVRPGIDEVKA